MARKTDDRSFFEWALPDWMDGRVTMLGLIFVLLLMALGLFGVTIRHLSVDGGRDQIAAGVPAIDDPKSPDQIAAGVPAVDDPAPPDQIAAGFPGQDDPDRLTSPPVEVEETEDDAEGVENEEAERESGSGISDDSPPDQVVTIEPPPLFRTGSWTLSVTETGDAACGYPTKPLVYDVQLMIALVSDDDSNDDQTGNDDEEEWYEISLQHPHQIFVGGGSSLPVVLETDGQGYQDVVTITEIDTDGGTFQATEVYTAPDGCEADRLWVGTFNF